MTERASVSPYKILGIAAIAGVLVGALAIYVKEAPSGKETSLASGDVSQCTLSDAKKAKLDAAATDGVAAMRPVSEPKQFSSLAFNDSAAKPITLANFKGKTVLLNIWATWCVPCRAEMPELDALQAQSGSDKFEVVAVNVDNDGAEKAKAFLSEIGIRNLKSYGDPTMALFNDVKREGLALGLPVSLLIGPDGCLLSAMNGPAAWGGADAKKLIDTAVSASGT